MTDPRIAALAEALRDISGGLADPLDPGDFLPGVVTAQEFAAAILAALPPDWCGHIGVEAFDAKAFAAVVVQRDRMTDLYGQSKAEIARLRKIEEASRALDESGYLYEIAKLSMEGETFVAALRAALEEKPQDRGEVRLPPPDPSIVGTEYGPLEEKP